MALTRGPRDRVCSARGCEEAATCAVVWSNPKIHRGREKTWLACEEHRAFLLDYVAYRGFPARVVALVDLPTTPA